MFRHGATRFVLLYGQRAIKIGRFRPIKVLGRLITLPFSKNKSFLKKGRGLWLPTWQYLFAGIIANKNEFQYSQNHIDDPLIAPITREILWGLVIIQLRTASVSEDEARAWWIERGVASSCLAGLCEQKHLGRTPDGHIVIVDYGSRVQQQQLSENVIRSTIA